MFSDLKKDNWKLSDFITYGHQAKTTKCQYLKTGSEFINLDKDSPAYSTNERDLCSLQNEIIDLELKVKQITDKLTNSSKIKLTKEEFLNLANSTHDKMMVGSPVEKDIILRKPCLNLCINDKRTPSFIWKEPFAMLIKSRKINSWCG